MGKPTPPNRPVVAGLTHVTLALFGRSSGYNDFVRAEPERQANASQQQEVFPFQEIVEQKEELQQQEKEFDQRVEEEEEKTDTDE